MGVSNKAVETKSDTHQRSNSMVFSPNSGGDIMIALWKIPQYLEEIFNEVKEIWNSNKYAPSFCEQFSEQLASIKESVEENIEREKRRLETRIQKQQMDFYRRTEYKTNVYASPEQNIPWSSTEVDTEEMRRCFDNIIDGLSKTIKTISNESQSQIMYREEFCQIQEFILKKLWTHIGEANLHNATKAKSAIQVRS